MSHFIYFHSFKYVDWIILCLAPMHLKIVLNTDQDLNFRQKKKLKEQAELN